MSVVRRYPTTDSVAFEIDAGVVRGEAIRAIRGFVTRSDQLRVSAPTRAKPSSFYAIVRIMRDLELTLAAISGSLAEGVEHTVGGKRTPP